MALKLKTRTQFPAVVTASDPIIITKSGITYSFSFNMAPVIASLSSNYALLANNLSDLAFRYTAKDNISIHGADIASAGTVNLETATGDLVDVTGTTTITAITLNEGHERTVRFTGILALTNGASLVLPGGANITTAAGDFAVFRGYAAGVVRCVGYAPASGKGVIKPAVGDITGLGTGIATALAINTGTNGAPALFGGALGAATATSINGNTFTSGTYTLTGAASKTLTFNNSLTLSGTDATTLTFPSTSATIARTDAGQNFTGAQGVINNTSTAFTVGQAAGANTAFTVDASTGSLLAGLSVKGAATGGTVALACTDTGSNTNLTIDAKGTGTVTFGSVSSGNFIFNRTLLSTTVILSSGATGGIGYATGAGGTVTQATSKSTGVTLNTVCGAITMNAAALAAGTIVTFNVTNSAMAATDVVIANHISGGTTCAYTINARANSLGNFAVDVRNNTAGSLSEALVIQFAIHKAVNA